MNSTWVRAVCTFPFSVIVSEKKNITSRANLTGKIALSVKELALRTRQFESISLTLSKLFYIHFGLLINNYEDNIPV